MLVLVGYHVGFLQSVVEAVGMVIVGCTVEVAQPALVNE